MIITLVTIPIMLMIIIMVMIITLTTRTTAKMTVVICKVIMMILTRPKNHSVSDIDNDRLHHNSA